MAADVETVIVRNDIAELPAVYAALEAFAGTVGLTDAVRRTLLLVVEELFSNTVSYGYPDGGKDEIEVSAALGPDHVELTLADRALPFDSSAPPAGPAEVDDLDAMGIGGLGLFLVHQFADTVVTERTGGVNRTRVLLPTRPD
ncbi:ATP-binding protein [Roseibium marinum]|uniref:Serine/threonine-protein kinase RsbW n=1 Tax=Roseibium marinum TaxID=281252 RepID=A0A2S3V1F4_9HYPH|nr:ATP-binding protein [Roseibium marinum]POF33802.1 serine/threonine-protein kinase RsbW [Roseibium marinum]